MAQANPFTMVYDALWELPVRHYAFDTIVKPGNRIKYNGPRDPIKQVVAAGDVPELILVNSTSTAKIHSTSSSSECTRQYSWLISTGDWRVNEFLHQVEWALFIAMLEWKEVLGSLTWHDKPFVKRCDIISITNGQSDAERNRGLKGWSAIWGCDVQMVFKTSDLISELQEP